MRFTMSLVRSSTSSSLEIWAVILLTPSSVLSVFEIGAGRLEVDSDMLRMFLEMVLAKGWKVTREVSGIRMTGAVIFGI